MLKKCLALFLLCNAALAADANNPRWQFDIAPYLWAMNMNGRIASGPVTAHINQNFSDILREFDGGGMLFLQAHKGAFGLFGNALYAVLSQSKDVRTFDAKLKTRFGLFAGGLSYIIFQEVYKNSRLQLEPYIGARYTMNDARLTIASLAGSNNQSWTDPLIGMRLNYDINQNWVTLFAGDIGGKNTSTQYSYDLHAFVGYKPSSCALRQTSFYLGYRYLYQHYDRGEGLTRFEWNMRLFGPVLGVNFNF
ncbi:MAG: hypothetical protein H0W64_12040 [Gammaproteobacteria bacterium]|nr:hypothetical protein [Gammaproteobacteria bacterium]